MTLAIRSPEGADYEEVVWVDPDDLTSTDQTTVAVLIPGHPGDDALRQLVEDSTRQVTTRGGLDTLPLRSVVVDTDGEVWICAGRGLWVTVTQDRPVEPVDVLPVTLPARVLYDPSPRTTS